MNRQPPGTGVNWASLPSRAEMISPSGYVAGLTVPQRVESVRPASMFIVQTVRALKVPVATHPLFEVAVTEALTNAVKHGYNGDAAAVIDCQIELDPQQLKLRIMDNGAGFVIPDRRVPAITTADVQAIPESGYGLPIIQTVFPVVRGVRINGRFALELCAPLV